MTLASLRIGDPGCCSQRGGQSSNLVLDKMQSRLVEARECWQRVKQFPQGLSISCSFALALELAQKPGFFLISQPGVLSNVENTQVSFSINSVRLS